MTTGMPASIRRHVRVEGTTAVIRVSDDFSLGSRSTFEQAAEEALQQEGVRELHLDMAGLNYIDSSALGMLLILRRRAGRRRVHLVNCQPPVRETLAIAHFGTLFSIN